MVPTRDPQPHTTDRNVARSATTNTQHRVRAVHVYIQAPIRDNTAADSGRRRRRPRRGHGGVSPSYDDDPPAAPRSVPVRPARSRQGVMTARLSVWAQDAAARQPVRLLPPCRGSDDAGRRSSGTTTTTRRPPGRRRRRRRSKMERRRSPRQRNRTNFLSAGDQLVAHDKSLGRRLGARTERRRRARITATEHYYYPSSPLLHQNVRSRNAEKDTRKEEGNARAKEKQTRQRGGPPSSGGFSPPQPAA